MKMKYNYLKKIRPEYLFISVLFVIPAFLFQKNVMLKWIHVMIFMFVSFSAGKRIRILPNIIMLSGITAANLLTPVGKVLFYLFIFPVTSGALVNGLEKSALLIGMIYLSKTALSGEFSMTGKKGNIFSELFFYFEKIMEGENSLSGKSNIKSDRREEILNRKCKDEFEDREGSFSVKDGSNAFAEKKEQRGRTVSALINDLICRTDRRLLAIENSSNEGISRKTESTESYSIIFSLLFFLFFVSVNWGIFFIL